MADRSKQDLESLVTNGFPHDWKAGAIHLEPELMKHINEGLTNRKLMLFLFLAHFLTKMNPFVFTLEEMANVMIGSYPSDVRCCLEWLTEKGYIRWRTERFYGQVWESVTFLDKGLKLCA